MAGETLTSNEQVAVFFACESCRGLQPVASVRVRSGPFQDRPQASTMGRALRQSQSTVSHGWNATQVSVGKGPEGFDVSPDGKEVWAANSHDGTISIIDFSKKAVVQTLNVGTRMANQLKFTPDGKFVFISDLGGHELVVVDIIARKELKRLELGGGAAGILMQPDGLRAYVAVGSQNGVTIIDLKTMEAAGHIETGPGPDGLACAIKD